MHAPAERKKPVVVKVDGFPISIYRLRTGQHCFTYERAGKRVFKRFRDLAKAKAKAAEVAIQLANGHRDMLDLTAADRDIYLHVKKTADSFGVALSAIVEEWAELKRSGLKLANVPLSQVLAAFTAHKLS